MPLDTVITAEYVAGLRLVVFTETVTVPLLLLPDGLTSNHVALSETLQLSVPPPLLVIVKLWLDGNAPFCTALKLMLVLFTTR